MQGPMPIGTRCSGSLANGASGTPEGAFLQYLLPLVVVSFMVANADGDEEGEMDCQRDSNDKSLSNDESDWFHYHFGEGFESL